MVDFGRKEQGLENWEALKGEVGSVYFPKIFWDFLKWSLFP